MASHASTPLAVLLAAIPSLPRPALARLTQRLIDRLDDMDGDPDLEPGDEDREHDGTEPEEGVIFPRYGINQARGPLNQS